jgi:type I restriction enzyme, S subunit
MWQNVKFANAPLQIIDGDRGKNYPKKSEFLESGYCLFLDTKNVRPNGFNFSNNHFISEEKDSLLKKGKIARNDIVMTTRGTLGNVGYYGPNVIYDNIRINSGMIILRANSELLLPLFLYQYIRSPLFQKLIYLFRSGSAQPQLPIRDINYMGLPLPILPTQKKIASILSNYDNLIENNTKRIQILEEMAKRIYKEWFVDFKYPGHENDELVDSELGMIPERWKVKSLKNFGKVLTGSTPSKKVPEFYGKEVPFIKTPDMHDDMFCIKTGEYLSILGSDSQIKKMLPKNTLCVSCIGTAGVVSITTENSHTNQQINSIVLNDQTNREYLYFSLLNLKKTIEQYGATGATMANLSKGKFEALKIVFPNISFINEFHQICMPIFSKILNLQYSIQKLKKTRDYLLPKLISGKVDVSELDIDTSILDD